MSIYSVVKFSTELTKQKGELMRKGIFLVIFGMLISSSIYGMSITDIVQGMNIRYDRLIKKSGGIKITQEVKNITDGVSVLSTQTIFKKGHLYKIETISQMDLDKEKTRNVVLFDGKNIWLISPFVGITMMPKDEAMIQGIFDSFSKLIPQDSKIVGEDKLSDDDCYIIKIPSNAKLPFSKIWVSKTRLIPLKAIGQYNNKSIILTFKDYKKINGEWGIPYKTEIMLDGKLISTTLVKKVETNIDIPNNIFDINSEKIK